MRPFVSRMRPQPATAAPFARFHTSRFALEAAKEQKPAEEKAGDKKDAKDAKKPEAKGEKKEVDYEALLKEKETELKDMKDKNLRTLADMQNLRDRVARDSENAKKYAISKFSKDLLDVADILEMALKSTGPKVKTSDNKDLKDFYDGILLTEKTLMQTFGRHGITKFKSLGEKFDPNLHDGLYAFEDPNFEPNTCGNVVKEGYMMKDMCLRPAQVGTVKAADAKK